VIKLVKVKIKGFETILTEEEAETLQHEIQIQLMELDEDWINVTDEGYEGFASYQLHDV